jgi:DNA-binding CsgD family transcriptional regulator
VPEGRGLPRLSRPDRAVSWATIPPELREIIERACTPREIEALKLRAAGYGIRRIARALDLDPSTVRARLNRAERKIRAETAAQRGQAWPEI